MRHLFKTVKIKTINLLFKIRETLLSVLFNALRAGGEEGRLFWQASTPPGLKHLT